MEDNVPLPRINKIPFIVADVLLVATAATIWFRTPPPLSPISIFWIFAAIFVGAFIACLPFYVEFRTLAKLKEYDLSQANVDNARRIESAMLGIQEVGETLIQHVDRNTETAVSFETLLERMEARIAEIQAPTTAIAGIDPDQLAETIREQLDAVRDDFAQAITEQVALTSDQQHNKLNAALSKLQGLPMQVSLLGELATRYQSLIAMMSDTAALLVTSAPVEPATPKAKSEPATIEDSVDGVLEADVEENVAAEAVTYGEVRIYREGEQAEYESDDIDSDAEPEFLLPEDLAHTPVDLEGYDQLDARFDAEMEAEVDETDADEPESEEVKAEEPEALDELKELDELEEEVLEEDDFDIALSSEPEEAEDDDEEVSEEAVASVAEEPVDETGMGFEDWDDFGEIAAAEEEDAEDGTPAQPELIGDLPPASDKSKAKKQKGVTTLIAQVLIGIGNKPYVRGVGPGLSETVGVPMEFLEIGKWQWVAPSSDEPVSVQIYKNDEHPAEGDPIEIPAGQRRSAAPKFPK